MGRLSPLLFILCFFADSTVFALDRVGVVSNGAGEVVSVSGNVYVKPEAASTKEAPYLLKPGNNIFAGDVIKTDSDGAVKILLKDKSILDIGPASLFKVSKFNEKSGADREVALDMKFGKVRIGVSKKLNEKGSFNLKTRAITMGVRGTEFVVAASNEASAGKGNQGSPPPTEVTVLQGRVDVSKVGAANAPGAAAVPLTAGSKLSSASLVGATSNLSAVKLNATQLASVVTGSKITDHTFSKSVTIEPVVESRTSSSNSSSNNSSNNAQASNSSSSNNNGSASSAGSGSASSSSASSGSSSAASGSNSGGGTTAPSTGAAAPFVSAPSSSNNAPLSQASASAGVAISAAANVSAPGDGGTGRAPSSDGTEATASSGDASTAAPAPLAANGASAPAATLSAPVAVAPSVAAPVMPVAGSLQSIIQSVGGIAPPAPISFSNIGLPGAPSVATVAPVTQTINRTYQLTVHVTTH